MAEEADGANATEPIVSLPFAAPISWSDFDHDIQIAAVKLAIRRTRSIVIQVREQVQAEANVGKDALLDAMQQASDNSVPLIKGLLEDHAVVEADKDNKLIGLLGNAYGTLAWGYGLFDLPRCRDLFDLMISLEAEHPNVPGLCNGVTFALLPLMPDEDSDQDDRAMVQEQIGAFLGLFDRSSGDDDSTWQVDSAGCLAALTQHMPDDEALQAALKASRRLMLWSASAWNETNTAFSVQHIFDSLSRARSTDEVVVDARMQEVLEVYCSKAPTELRHKLINTIARLLTSTGTADPVRDLLVAELCEFLETVQDVELIESAVPDLAVNGGRSSARGIRLLWSAVRKARNPLVQKFWLSGLANCPPETFERETADEHLRHLREIRAVPNDLVVSLWTGALLSVGIALVARNEAQPLREIISELAGDPSCPMDHWLDAAGIAVLGAGREAPDWLEQLLGLTEVAAKEPVNPMLRAGLSYFLSAALTESKSISGTDFGAQLDLLERVTMIVTPND
ncbi:MAG: hypothetical protein AAFR71_15405 [Pseudomonadota bacterium]